MIAHDSIIKDVLDIDNKDGTCNIYVTFDESRGLNVYPGISCFTNVCEKYDELSGDRDSIPPDYVAHCYHCLNLWKIEPCSTDTMRLNAYIPDRTIEDINYYIETSNIADLKVSFLFWLEQSNALNVDYEKLLMFSIRDKNYDIMQWLRDKWVFMSREHLKYLLYCEKAPYDAEYALLLYGSIDYDLLNEIDLCIYSYTLSDELARYVTIDVGHIINEIIMLKRKNDINGLLFW